MAVRFPYRPGPRTHYSYEVEGCGRRIALQSFARSSCGVAEQAAEHFHVRNQGYRERWPVRLRLYDAHGDYLATYEVSRQLIFRAAAVKERNDE